MNKQTAHNLLMDYLYDEISAADKEKLEAYLQDQPELQQELNELRDTRSLLQKAPEVEPENKLTMVESSGGSFAAWRKQAAHLLPNSVWGKTALAAAACLVFLLVAASVVNLSIQSTPNGLSIHFGYGDPPATAALSQSQTEAIIKQVRRENTAILTEYADMLNKHNQQQLQQVVEHLERERRNDLQTISTALNQYQQKTDYQLQQTHEVMGQMLQTVASNIQQ